MHVCSSLSSLKPSTTTYHTSAMAIKLPPPEADHARALCRSRLSSALRTALACSIVGISSVYAPPAVRHHIIRFPAFSYVVALLIAADATLGGALRGAALAVYATMLGLLPAMLTAYMIRPEGMSAATASAAVAVSAFVVVVSDSSELVTKRIALGQIVLVYVAAFDFSKGQMRPVLHPLPVAASTALGAAAAVVALVVPYPRLACYEVRKKSKSYTDTSEKRLRLLLDAFCADSNSCRAAFISQANSLGRTCTKLLNSVRDLQGTMQWERPPFKCLPPFIRSPSERLQAIETSLNGMEMALISSAASSPLKTLDQPALRDDILNLQHTMSLSISGDPNSKSQNVCNMDKALQSLHDLPQNPQGLSSLFFLFCMKLLFDGALALTVAPSPPQREDNKVIPTTDHEARSCKQEGDQEEDNSNSIAKKSVTRIQSMCAMRPSTKKVVAALKCSLSLGLAIFLGLLFSEGNGYWAGLAVAITFSPSGKSTFGLAGVRAHGTAIGSVFGLLVALVSQSLMEVRLLSLIPWVVFTSFLQHSRMYGQGGAISAVLSAMVIVGRKDYGSPTTFAINRLTETYIGLCCAVFAEILMQPTRASTLARGRLAKSLHALGRCVDSLTSPEELKEKEKKLRRLVKEMKGYSAEAALEPDFWFLPFPTSCYSKLHGSLAKVGDTLVFLAHSMEVLTQECCEIEGEMKEDMDKLKEAVGGLVKCLEEVIKVKSLERLGKETKGEEEGCNDIEAGRKGQCGNFGEEIVATFVQNAKEIVERLDEDGAGELRTQLVLCFGTIGYCVGVLMREMRETEKGILELVQWENPSSYINLHEIFCKLKEASNC